MSLPRPFFCQRPKLVALTAALGIVNIAQELDLRAGELRDDLRGHGHRSGRNNPGSSKKPGTGKKYRLTKNRR